MLLQELFHVDGENGEVLDFKELDVVEDSVVFEVLDGGADVLQCLQLEKQGGYVHVVGIRHKAREVAQHVIAGGDVVSIGEHVHVEEDAPCQPRLQFKLVKHESQCARGIYDIFQLHQLTLKRS